MTRYGYVKALSLEKLEAKVNKFNKDKIDENVEKGIDTYYWYEPSGPIHYANGEYIQMMKQL